MREIKLCFKRIIQAAWVEPTVTRNYGCGLAVFSPNMNPHHFTFLLLPVQGKRPFLEGGTANPEGWWARQVHQSLN